MVITVTEYNNGGIVAEMKSRTWKQVARVKVPVSTWVIYVPGFGWAHDRLYKTALRDSYTVKKVLKYFGSDTAQYMRAVALVNYVHMIKESGELRTYTIDVDT